VLAVLVMLNNYLHDLSTAVFAVSVFTAHILCRSVAMREAPAVLRPVAQALVRVAMGALVWTLAGGAVRAAAYRKYEWMEAAGRGQVAALVLKHVILVSLVVAALVLLRRVRRLAWVASDARAETSR